MVAGTSIGAGMLALPVVTALGGFFPAFFIYLLCWLFMTCTGLLLLEICLKLPPDANLISMAGHYLGRPGKVFAWVLFLLLFAPIVYRGARMVDRLNHFLMGGLIATYLAFVFLGFPHVQWEPLQKSSWGQAIFALPVIFTSFSYQGTIPSLIAYLHRDARNIRLAILLGTSIAFLIYLLWEFLILGIIPVEGEFGLAKAMELGQTAVAPLRHHVESRYIPLIGQAFAFFAIATSFLGVTLGLLDFLADGLKMPKKGVRHLFLALLTFGPPTLVALVNPTLFITALIYAGGIGCALLLGFLPTLMVWVARYVRREDLGTLQLAGGRTMLSFLFLFVFLELAMEFWRELSS